MFQFRIIAVRDARIVEVGTLSADTCRSALAAAIALGWDVNHERMRACPVDPDAYNNDRIISAYTGGAA